MAPMTTNDNEIGRPLAPPPETLLSRLFEPLGQRVVSLVNNLGAAAIFLIKALVLIFGRKQFRAIVQQINIIGAKTVNIVALVGFFTGMVMGLQLYYTLVKYGSTGVLGSAVALSIIRELGPLLAAVVVILRSGSAIAIEMGYMTVLGEIESLEMAGVHPLHLLA